MAKAEKILLTEPGVRLDMTKEETYQLKNLLYDNRSTKELSRIFHTLIEALRDNE